MIREQRPASVFELRQSSFVHIIVSSVVACSGESLQPLCFDDRGSVSRKSSSVKASPWKRRF